LVIIGVQVTVSVAAVVVVIVSSSLVGGAPSYELKVRHPRIQVNIESGDPLTVQC